MSKLLENIERDPQGFLKNLDDWTIDIAKSIANEEEISLSSDHIIIINLLRNHYIKYNSALSIRPLVKLIEKEFGKEKGNSIYLHQLFAERPAILANKIAGLPKPVNCI